MQLSGKVALVTGGTDGIGAQLIRQLRDKGATIVTSGRDPARIAATRAAGFEVIAADLSTVHGVDALIEGLADRPIDLLVNNAGMGADYDFRDGQPDLAETERGLFLNLHAPIHLITRLMPVLRARPEATIVNVTSGLAIAPRAGGPIYCATKAALRSYTQAVRAQLVGTKITMIEALPPMVETRMTAGRANKKMSAQDCAGQIVAGIETGTTEVNVGMVKLLQVVNSISPALARRIMLKF